MAPINLEKLREVTEGDAALERQLFMLYFDTAERCLASLKTQIHVDDGATWKNAAHELKGASANIQAGKIAELCKFSEHLPADEEERERTCQLIEEGLAEIRAFLKL